MKMHNHSSKSGSVDFMCDRGSCGKRFEVGMRVVCFETFRKAIFSIFTLTIRLQVNSCLKLRKSRYSGSLRSPELCTNVFLPNLMKMTVVRILRVRSYQIFMIIPIEAQISLTTAPTHSR